MFSSIVQVYVSVSLPNLIYNHVIRMTRKIQMGQEV